MERDKHQARHSGNGLGRGGDGGLEPPLPGVDEPYIAVSRTLNPHGEPCLVVILGEDGYKGDGKRLRFYQYVHLASDGDFGTKRMPDGLVLQMFTLVFLGLEPVKLILYGYNLERMAVLINQHRVPWIRVLDQGRKFVAIQEERGKKAEIITSIEIIRGEQALTAAAPVARVVHDAARA